MPPNDAMCKLTEAHTLLISLSEQGEVSAVLKTLASVLTTVVSLDKLPVEPHYWHSVARNLNALVDICQQNEYEGGTPFGTTNECDVDSGSDYAEV